MPCYRCGARQVDPDRGESPWKRGVRADRQVLICPGCQSSGDWLADLLAIGERSRALMRAHPWLPGLMIAHPVLGPNGVALLEHVLIVLQPHPADVPARAGVPPQAGPRHGPRAPHWRGARSGRPALDGVSLAGQRAS